MLSSILASVALFAGVVVAQTEYGQVCYSTFRDGHDVLKRSHIV